MAQRLKQEMMVASVLPLIIAGVLSAGTVSADQTTLGGQSVASTSEPASE